MQLRSANAAPGVTTPIKLSTSIFSAADGTLEETSEEALTECQLQCSRVIQFRDAGSANEYDGPDGQVIGLRIEEAPSARVK